MSNIENKINSYLNEDQQEEDLKRKGGKRLVGQGLPRHPVISLEFIFKSMNNAGSAAIKKAIDQAYSLGYRDGITGEPPKN